MSRGGSGPEPKKYEGAQAKIQSIMKCRVDSRQRKKHITPHGLIFGVGYNPPKQKQKTS